MKIAIAEDVALLREGIAAILEQNGHTVLWSVADATALRGRFWPSPDAELPDVLIADVRMPPDESDDGLRAAVAIRREFPQIGILILSQHLGNEYAKELLSTAPEAPGGTGYLLKERVGRVSEFLSALDAIGHGGVSIDSKVIAHLLNTVAPSVSLAALAPREQEVLQLMAEGRTNSQIGDELYLSAPTVEKHIGSIFLKLGFQRTDGNKRVLAVLEYLRG
jgi:DNA-binding NarL/FixJ family response regulator